MELQIPAVYKRRDIPGNTKTKHVQLHIIRWTWITIKIVRQDYNSPKLHKTIADYTGYPQPHRLNFSITCSSAPRQLVQQ